MFGRFRKANDELTFIPRRRIPEFVLNGREVFIVKNNGELEPITKDTPGFIIAFHAITHGQFAVKTQAKDVKIDKTFSVFGRSITVTRDKSEEGGTVWTIRNERRSQ